MLAPPLVRLRGLGARARELPGRALTASAELRSVNVGCDRPGSERRPHRLLGRADRRTGRADRRPRRAGCPQPPDHAVLPRALAGAGGAYGWPAGQLVHVRDLGVEAGRPDDSQGGSRTRVRAPLGPLAGGNRCRRQRGRFGREPGRQAGAERCARRAVAGTRTEVRLRARERCCGARQPQGFRGNRPRLRVLFGAARDRRGTRGQCLRGFPGAPPIDRVLRPTVRITCGGRSARTRRRSWSPIRGPGRS